MRNKVTDLTKRQYEKCTKLVRGNLSAPAGAAIETAPNALLYAINRDQRRLSLKYFVSLPEIGVSYSSPQKLGIPASLHESHQESEIVFHTGHVP